MQILFTASDSPLRLISTLALLGAGLNLIYSIYVVIVSFTQTVEAGWTSMSLQISGMFFLISLVLSAMAEFLIFISKSISQGPAYFVREEISSKRLGLQSEINVADLDDLSR
jgi:hypothetical protein